MKKLILIALAWLCVAVYTPSAAMAEPAPHDFTVEDCGHVTWTYDGSNDNSGTDLYRTAWLGALATIESISNVRFYEATAGEVPDITATWKESVINPARGGETDVYTRPEDGVVTHADIRIAPSVINYFLRWFKPWSLLSRVRGTMIHELGHALGLGHSVETYKNIMSQNPRRGIKPDDRIAFAGIC